LSLQTKTDPEFGVTYSYDSVANFYAHDQTLLSFVIVKGPRVLALRLREDYNPKIFGTPAQLWVGESPNAVGEWGKVIASETATIPVFVKRNGKQSYTFVGNHAVVKRESTPAELAMARADVPHTRGVSRIVYLKRV